ncbi:MAG: hypothetical protein CVU39_15345 [Chloroflexi bacterium HGW-Chloroflexi-10]|nr:MAG: hypothetical protein CVU39_15345 [Chloroflexi bacterium HGW-Chloroflexi-10]
MTPILDPNISFVLLVGGLLFSVLALLTPGTGVMELGGLFALILAGYGIISSPVHLWALIILAPFIPLMFFYRKQKKTYQLILAIILLNAGSYMLFRNASNGFAVSPILALIVFLVDAPIFWFLSKKIVEALDHKPDFNPNLVIGMIGEAKTNIFHEGTVFVGRENWSSKSRKKISVGKKVRVIGKEGLTLFVEEVEHEV